MSKLLENIVMDLSRKVDQGFDNADKKMDKIQADLVDLTMKVKQQQMTILDHSYTDIETSSRIKHIEEEIEELEKIPYRLLRKSGTVLVATVGVISTLISIAWGIRNLISG